jgi:hypothetical protein
MTQVRLALRDEDGKTIEEISAEFQAADLSLLSSFVDWMSRVRSCSVMMRGMPSIRNIKLEAGIGLAFTSDPYTNAELYELLHVLRPLILQDEATYYGKVSKLLGGKFQSKNLSSLLKSLRKTFDHGELSMYMQITVNTQKLFDESILRIWLNATQYHTEADKLVTWQAIERSLATDNVRALVMMQLRGKLKALMDLEHLANLVLDKHAVA